MAVVRVAKQEDKTEFYRLWKTCFGDSDAFCDWFFENRFSPEHSIVLEAKDEIVSCMQAFPYTILIRGKEIPGAMLCGVSTHPYHRKKGFMGKIFSYEMNHLRSMSYCVAPHTPAVLPSYFSFGHFPVADAAYLKCKSVPSVKSTENFYIIDKTEWYRLFPLYESFAEKYSGIIKRTEKDFLRKATDYAADGGKTAAYIENNIVKAYAFYYQSESKMVCVEAVAQNGYWEKLMEGLFTLSKGLEFTAKLPPEIDVSFPFAEVERLQKGVMGLCNISGLLEKLNLDIPYGFCLKDKIIPENNGIFNFKGKKSEIEPVFEISSGHLLQILIGYYCLSDLKHVITVFDENKFKEIDTLLPKQNCYIIDEY